jgi:hypothetical protein
VEDCGMNDEKNGFEVDPTRKVLGNSRLIFLVPLCLKWISRIVTVVFLCFLMTYFNAVQNSVVYLIEKVLPFSFFILFLFQMEYYFSWHRFENEKKSDPETAICVIYGKLKRELRYLSLTHGGILIALYLTRISLLKG